MDNGLFGRIVAVLGPSGLHHAPQDGLLAFHIFRGSSGAHLGPIFVSFVRSVKDSECFSNMTPVGDNLGEALGCHSGRIGGRRTFSGEESLDSAAWKEDASRDFGTPPPVGRCFRA